MTENDFDELCSKIREGVYNPTRGGVLRRFWRALWYGGNKNGFGGIPNAMVAYVANDQKGGIRKLGQNIWRPMIAATGGIIVSSFVLGTAAVTIPVAAATTLTYLLANRAITLSLNMGAAGIQGLTALIGDRIAAGISGSGVGLRVPGQKSAFRKIVAKIHGPKEPSPIASERLMNEIKEDVKDLRNGLGLQIVDRNVVKLQAAQYDMITAINELLKLKTMPNPTPVEISSAESHKRISNSLETVAETLHYIQKLKTLVGNIQEPLCGHKEEKEISVVEAKSSESIVGDLGKFLEEMRTKNATVENFIRDHFVKHDQSTFGRQHSSSDNHEGIY